MRGIRGCVVVLALALPAAGVDAAELRRVEAVGAVPAGADAPAGVPVRRAALEAAATTRSGFCRWGTSGS